MTIKLVDDVRIIFYLDILPTVVNMVISNPQAVPHDQRVPHANSQQIGPLIGPQFGRRLANIDTGHPAEIGPETHGASHLRLGGIPW